jgi:2,3-bisphosphoglycerate-dependent phosphoglycerate mutase
MVTRPTVLRLVRHGESTWNLARRIQGQSPEAGPLTPLGRGQVRATGELLLETAPGAAVVVSSDLQRARESALIIAAALGLPACCDPGLRERRFGDLEGRCLDDRLGEGTVEDAVERLWSDPWLRPPGGESVLEVHRRVRSTLVGLAARWPGREIVVVTHGGAIRVAGAERPEDVRHRTVANASVTTLRIAAPALLTRSAALAS